MTGKSEQTDLCINCLNIADCFYCRGKAQPVHFCEEFTCQEPAESLKEIERLKRAKVMVLPNSRPGIFDDCGKAVP